MSLLLYYQEIVFIKFSTTTKIERIELNILLLKIFMMSIPLLHKIDILIYFLHRTCYFVNIRIFIQISCMLDALCPS